jgi:hypothetical protein
MKKYSLKRIERNYPFIMIKNTLIDINLNQTPIPEKQAFLK